MTHTLSTVYNYTSIGMQCLAAEKGTLTGSEEHVASRNFNRLTYSVHGCPISQAMALLALLADACGRHWRPDRTSSDCVDADALLHQLIREGASERDDGSFARGVVEAAWNADVRIHRCAIDDGSSFAHVWQHGFGQVEV